MVKIFVKQNIIFFINKHESTGLKHFNDSKVLIEYSSDMVDIYKKKLKNIIQIKNIKC